MRKRGVMRKHGVMRKRKDWIAVALVAVLLAVAVVLAGSMAPGATSRASATGSSPSPWPSPSPGVVLQVGQNGTFVKAYTLADLEALAPFAGYAGFKNDANNVTGPEAVTGVKITDIVQDELGTPLTAAQAVNVIGGDGYTQKFLYDQIVSQTGLTMWDATTKQPVSVSSLAGPLASVLVYAAPDPPGDLLANGPLRFMVVDATSENAVMTGSDSPYDVAKLDVIPAATVKDFSLKLTGLKVKGKRQTRTITRTDFQSCVNCHGASYKVSGNKWSGTPLYYLVGEVDGGATMGYNATLAKKGYRIELVSTTGKTRIVSSRTIIHKRAIVLAWQRNGAVLGSSLFPLRLIGPKLKASQELGRIKSVVLLPLVKKK
jgi:hypothetical protein